MGDGESGTPSKTPKASSAQEQTAPINAPTVFPDWSSFQAYYNSGGASAIPHGFYPPVAASHPTHAYMWPPQHVMTPYGTPPPYVAMYPHGGIYSHPHIPPGTHPYGPYAVPTSNGTGEASVLESGGVDLDSKTNENGKGSCASANNGASQSGDSGAEGSSEGSDAQSPDVTDKQLACVPVEVQDGIAVGNATGSVAQSTAAATLLPHASALVPISPNAIAGPTTTLNIGMDYWGGTTSSSVTHSRSKLPVKPATGSTLSSSRDGVPSDLWLQDEREIKRQKRKQSNRESARRSRLRKQAECEELAQRVSVLKEENRTLAEELQRMRDECERLSSENAALSAQQGLICQLKGKDASDDQEGPVDPQPNSPEASANNQ